VNGTLVLATNNGMNDFLNLSLVARRTSEKIMDPEQRINPQLTSADYDSDGDIDLLVGDNSGKTELFLNNGKGVFSSKGIIGDFGCLSWGLTSVDLNDDGYIDVVVATAADDQKSSTPGYLYVIWNSGNTDCFTKEDCMIIGNISQIPGTGSLISLDIDNDSDSDFIIGISDELYAFENKDGLYSSGYICKIPMTSEGYAEDLSRGGLDVGDFNNDGFDDFITGGCQGAIRLFINKGDQIHSN